MPDILSLDLTRFSPTRLGKLQVGAALGAALLCVFLCVHETDLWPDGSGSIASKLYSLTELGLCGACGIYGLAHLPRTWKLFTTFPAAWTVILVGAAILSVPLAANVPVSIGATASLMCVVLFVPAVLIRYGSRSTITMITGTMLVFLVACVVAYVFVPGLGKAPYEFLNPGGTVRLGGLQHPNGAARLAAVTTLLMIALVAGRVFPWWIIVAPAMFCAGFIYMANSRTTMVALAAAIGLSLFRKMNGLGKVAAIAAVGFAAFGIWAIMPQADRVTSQLVRDSGNGISEVYTMTGRTELWGYVVDRIKESPLVGYGFGCARFVTVESEWKAQHAHNTLLNITLTTGVIGGAVFLMTAISLLIGMFRRPDWLADPVFLFLAICSCAEPVAFNSIPDTLTIIWIVLLYWRVPGMSFCPVASSTVPDRAPATIPFTSVTAKHRSPIPV